MNTLTRSQADAYFAAINAEVMPPHEMLAKRTVVRPQTQRQLVRYLKRLLSEELTRAEQSLSLPASSSELLRTSTRVAYECINQNLAITDYYQLCDQAEPRLLANLARPTDTKHRPPSIVVDPATGIPAYVIKGSGEPSAYVLNGSFGGTFCDIGHPSKLNAMLDDCSTVTRLSTDDLSLRAMGRLSTFVVDPAIRSSMRAASYPLSDMPRGAWSRATRTIAHTAIVNRVAALNQEAREHQPTFIY